MDKEAAKNILVGLLVLALCGSVWYAVGLRQEREALLASLPNAAPPGPLESPAAGNNEELALLRKRYQASLTLPPRLPLLASQDLNLSLNATSPEDLHKEIFFSYLLNDTPEGWNRYLEEFPGNDKAPFVQARLKDLERTDLGGSAENWFRQAYAAVGAEFKAAYYQRALEMDGNIALAWNNLGSMYVEMGYYSQGEKAIYRALQLDPGNATSYYNLGLAALKGGDFPLAVAHFRKAVTLKPDFSDAWFNLGTAAASIPTPEVAEEAFRRFLELEPTGFDGFTNLGMILVEKGAFVEAHTMFRKALDIVPDYYLALFGEGYALEKEGKPVEAAEYYRQALKAAPQYDLARLRLASLASQLPDAKKK